MLVNIGRNLPSLAWFLSRLVALGQQPMTRGCEILTSWGKCSRWVTRYSQYLAYLEVRYILY
jgi:hypothetical protein